jgi:hypothetical protein
LKRYEEKCIGAETVATAKATATVMDVRCFVLEIVTDGDDSEGRGITAREEGLQRGKRDYSEGRAMRDGTTRSVSGSSSDGEG